MKNLLLTLILFFLPTLAFCEDPNTLIENKIKECEWLLNCQGPEYFNSQFYSNKYFYIKGQIDAYKKCLEILAD